MALNRTYAWYIEGDKVALVESSANDSASPWTSITTAGKTLRVLSSFIATEFDTTLTDDNKTYNLDTRFRRILADYAIATGYEMPENQDLKSAGYFLQKFRSGIISIKKSKNYQKIYGVLAVKPHYF